MIPQGEKPLIRKQLKQTKLFGELPQDEFECLVDIARIENSQKGNFIFSQGDVNRGFFVLVSGKVKVFKVSIGGKEHILHIVSPHESFSEAATFGNINYPASAQALENTSLVLFPRKEFMSILTNQPKIATSMLWSMSRWLKRMTDHIHSITSQSVDERLANFIVAGLKKRNIEPANGSTLTLDISKSVLASRLGTTPETLSRTFQKARSEKVIKMNKNQITILDIERLYMLSIT